MALGALALLDAFGLFELFEHLFQVFVGDYAALAPQDFAAAEEDQRWHRCNAVAGDEVARAAVVDIDLVDVDAALHLLLEAVDNGVHHPARTAPGGEKVDEGQRVPPDNLIQILHFYRS